MAPQTIAAPPRPVRPMGAAPSRPARPSGVRSVFEGLVHRLGHRLPGGCMYEVRVPFIGVTIGIPPPERLTYYAALAVLVAFNLIDWPLALIIAVGHFLAEQNLFRALKGVGKAAESL
ncbi:hypothetical protein [Sphaerisporangium krabiense]|uniref:Uncharacterized protein n=1 Tax=Sphaerisporangium krabiense TaxID=763782 RepID=A0A7W9DPC9_9ACTN|nr:hypothetical protein [Sphaerisporangium krabiense]MBB5626286.1 hypothetical protein [Sphaerisporangium krabiense]